ncbi:integral peroxisomal membrane, peroxin [Pseudohyphozyma bogoriensis]|nr:integral peroxisomal membrane, peroxin [Pseudohyphozyma bogoriensis]
MAGTTASDRRPSLTPSEDGATPKETRDKLSLPSSFASVKSGLDGLILSTLLTASSAPLPAGSTKEPLSLQTTSQNFRKFVQKSGPIFSAQAAVESVFRWEDTPKTVFFGGAWAFICIYPTLIFVIPNIALAAILLATHPSRHAEAKATSMGNSVESPTSFGFGGESVEWASTGSAMNAGPPAEGSVDYLANLTNIQQLMGQVSDASDLLRSFVPYLTWRSSRISLLLLQLTTLSGLFTFFVVPYLPLRMIFLFLGEFVLLSCHPIAQTLFKQAVPALKSTGSKWARWGEKIMEDDGMPEEELDGEVVVVERFDVESKVEGLGEFRAELSVGGDLPRIGDRPWAWKWIASQSEWRVDVEGEWAAGSVDRDGWCYLFIDGSRAATPSSAIGTATSRKRRLTRRAVNIVEGDHHDP